METQRLAPTDSRDSIGGGSCSSVRPRPPHRRSRACSHGPAGPRARGIRRRGADQPRGQPDGHQGLRYRCRRDDDPGAPGFDEHAPANSVELTNFYLRRIRQLNPKLNAVITVSPTARADARAADRARRQGDDRPLLGIPIIVKDNVNTTGMPTTAGSWALAGSTPDDAFIVAAAEGRRRDHHRQGQPVRVGQLPVRPSSSGWSGIGGQTNMPYVLDRNPCGSSSGSGVAAAADLAVAAVGTETDGSIVCPSGANGVVGIKPTLGLWSRAGVIPISADQDTAGPMARNVTDAAVLLGAATGVDPNDAATAAQAGNAFTDYTRVPRQRALEGARIGVWRAGTYNRDLIGPVVEPILDDVIDALEDQGATVDRPGPTSTSRRRRRVPGAHLRVQDGHREVPRDLRRRDEPGDGPRVPADARRPDRVQPGPSRPRGPVEQPHLRGAEATNGRDAACAGPARRRRRRRSGCDRFGVAAQRPRRDHRAHQRAAWPTNNNPEEGDLNGNFASFVGSRRRCGVGLPRYHGSGRLCAGPPIGVSFMAPAGASRCCSGSPTRSSRPR